MAAESGFCHDLRISAADLSNICGKSFTKCGTELHLSILTLDDDFKRPLVTYSATIGSYYIVNWSNEIAFSY